MSSSALTENPPNPSATTKSLSASAASTNPATTQQTRIAARLQHPVDAKLERLKKDILPSSPYLLRLRARSAQYHARDSYYWRKDTLFDEDEEELQYLTFRQIHDDTLLHAHGQWDDGNGGIAPKEFPSSQASSGRTPVAAQVAKKKISLAEYKKLDKSKPRTSDVNATAMKGPIETDSQDVKEAPKKEGEKKEDKIKGGAYPSNKSMEMSERNSELARKRSADTMTGANDPNVIEHGPLAPVSKKSRPTLEPTKDEHVKSAKTQVAQLSSAITDKPQEKDKSGVNEQKPSSSKPFKTPAASESETNPNLALRYGLPPMLSPTLPSDIEEELAKLTPSIRGGFVSSRVSSASPSTHIKDHKRAISASGQAKSLSAALVPSSPKQRLHHPKQITSAPRQQNQDQTSRPRTDSSTSIKKSKIVKLKIKNRGNRRTLIQYLRMKPTPNRGNQNVGSKSNISSDASVVNKSSMSKLSAQSKSSGQKKPSRRDGSSETDEPMAKRKPSKRRASEIEDDDFEEPSSKRGRGLGQKHKDVTPNQSQSSRQLGTMHQSKLSVKATMSTPTSISVPGSAQKAHLNVLSSAMQRTESQESVATPARDVTPTTNGHKIESPTRREWLKENKIETSRLLKLATEIKHDSDAFLKHLPGQAYEEQRKIGSVIATEAVLCFVLAGMVSDEPGRSSNIPSNTDLWKSTRDFIASLSSIHAKKFQYLFGFLKQLEGIVCDTLVYQHDMRGEAILREYNRLKGQESVAAVPNADSYIPENWIFLKEAQETRIRSRAVWREGQHALFDPDLERNFPNTWSRRRSFPGRGKGRDPVTLNNYSKEGFALPLGINSTGLDALNFGLSFLAEFCEKEGLQWKPKLVL